KCRGVRISDSGRRKESKTSSRIRNDIDESPCPAITSRPKMVENQPGLIERIQSMDMNVTETPQKSSPGPATAAMLPCATAGPSRSSTSDHRFIHQEQKNQPAK